MSRDRLRRLTRRDLLRAGVGAAAGLIVGRTAQGDPQPVRRAPSPKVVLVRRQRAALEEPSDAVVGAMLDDALVALTGKPTAQQAWATIAGPSDRVAVKATLMMTPTHAQVMRAIHTGLRSAGVAEDHIAFWDRNQAGYGREATDPETWRERPGFDEQSVSRLVSWATVLINAPGLKSHWLAGVACALKNWAGAMTNINVSDLNTPYPFHGDSCAEVGMLNAIPEIRARCRLVVADALMPLFEGGPQVDPRYRWRYGGLLLGQDPVAVDATGLRIIQAKRDQYRGGSWPVSPPAKSIAVADKKYHLGESDPARIALVKLGWTSEALI
jgi:hypothetical protein